MMGILITGGLGYIGSHIAHKLGNKSVILDDMSNSRLNYKKLLPKSIVYKDKINTRSLKKIFKSHDIKCVIHLASFKSVNDSIDNPIKYYDNNISSTLILLRVMQEFNILNLIFSSSATVYGTSNKSPLKENFDLSSSTPYGNSKIIIEKILCDISSVNKKMKILSLRYFNPIGSDLNAGLADQPLGRPENLMPIMIESIKRNKKLLIFGNDYNTRDGTCIRDYVHIKDIVKGHIDAISVLDNLKNYTSMNLGLGKGISVLELVKLFIRINKVKINYNFTQRRDGDVDICFADVSLAKKIISWKPKYNYEDMIKDSWKSAKVNL